MIVREEVGRLQLSNCADTRTVTAVVSAVRKCRRRVEVHVSAGGALVFTACLDDIRHLVPQEAEA